MGAVSRVLAVVVWYNGVLSHEGKPVMLSPVAGGIHASSTSTTELIPLTDAELDLVVGGLNFNSGNVSVGSVQGGTGNVNILSMSLSQSLIHPGEALRLDAAGIVRNIHELARQLSILPSGR